VIRESGIEVVIRAARARWVVASDARYPRLVGARTFRRWALTRPVRTRLLLIAYASGGPSIVTTTSMSASPRAGCATGAAMSAASAAAIRTPRLKENRLAATERVQDLSRVVGRLDAAEDLLDGAVRADHDGRALDAHVLLAGEALLAPEAVALRDLVVRVGEEREGQSVLLLELRVRLLAIRADAEDLGAGRPEGVPGVADSARLLGAAGGVVPGVEVEDDLLPAQVGEPDRLAGVGRQLEIGCRLAFLDHRGSLPAAPMSFVRFRRPYAERPRRDR